MPSFTATKSKTYFVEPGLYKIRVENAFLSTSQKGNEMMKLTCRVILGDNQKGPEIWHYLVFLDSMSEKNTDFAFSIGKKFALGDNVTLEPIDIVDCEGWALIGEKERANETDARFNEIKKWVHGEELARLRSKPAAKQIDDSDEIPF
jgi:hypothetical protein